MKVRYDLHIHTALSPCGDDDMTPFNIANMAKLNGLDFIAVTDHNSCGNCEAVMKAGDEIGLTVIAGMELETREEVHVVLLFPSLEKAKACETEVRAKMMPVKNRPDLFGEQLLMSETDEVIGREETLLVTATDVGVYEAVELAKRYDGIAFPAHIDRPSHGILEILGGIHSDMGFTTVEISQAATDEFVNEWQKKGYTVVRSSDSHYLHTIASDENEIGNFLELDCVTAQRVLSKLVKL